MRTVSKEQIKVKQTRNIIFSISWLFAFASFNYFIAYIFFLTSCADVKNPYYLSKDCVIQQIVKKRSSSCRLGNPHPRDRRNPLMVFTMPAERIRVDQRAPFLTPRPESLQPQPFAVLPDYPQECLHQQ